MRWRKFLETPASGVDSYVAITWDRDRTYPDANFKIADCDRRVNLYFGLNNEAAIRRSRRKLEGLKQAINRLEGIVSQYEEG